MAYTGDRIRELRKKLGLTQEQLADQVGVSRTTVVSWEKGKFEPERQNTIDLATVLKTTAAFLMGETDDPTPFNERNIPTKSNEFKNAGAVPFESNVSNVFTDLICLPVLSMEQTACCGHGIVELEITSSPNETIWVPLSLIGTYDQDHPPYAMQTDGESMENMGIPNESIVVVNPVEEIQSFDICLVCYHGRLAIKKVIFKPDGFEIMADNKEKTFIPKKDMDEEVFEIRGKVMQVVSKPRHGF